MAIDLLATWVMGVVAVAVLATARRPRRRAGAGHGRAQRAVARLTAGRRPVDWAA